MKTAQRKSSTSKAMKVAEDSNEDEDESSKDDDEVDEIAHLARRFSKAWIKRKKKGFVPKRDKKSKAKQDEVICFDCKEPRHAKSVCLRLNKASKIWIWYLGARNHILIKLDLVLRRKVMRNHPRSPKIIFLHVFIVSKRGHTSEKCFSKTKAKT